MTPYVMPRMTPRVVLLGLLVGLSAIVATGVATTRAQSPDRARLNAAKEMMLQSGAVRQFDEAVPLMLDQMRQGFTSVAPDKGKEIREVFELLVPRFLQRKGELIDQIAALYAAELSLEDLNAVIGFYRSPVGIRFADIQPKILRESMQLGQTWGERLGMELHDEARRELRRRGINM